jgi:UDP-N-acetylbacillosamine N-acetyltransferase
VSRRLLIFGAGGHAKVVAEVARANEFEVEAFFDSAKPDQYKEPFCRSKVLSSQEQLTACARDIGSAVIGVGDCKARLRIAQELEQLGFRFPVLVHPRATVSDTATVAVGSVVIAGAVVNAHASVSRHVIVNTSATVDHDCVIADGVHIGPGAHLGGGVSVGQRTWIGIGAIVKDRVIIGCNCIIGAGALVLDDIPDNVVAYGSPARIIRENT